jgi:hypothetical protein
MPRHAVDDRVRLLHGPYRAPRLHVGDRATCIFRDCLVVVTAWTDAPISWTRGVPVGDAAARQRKLSDKQVYSRTGHWSFTTRHRTHSTHHDDLTLAAWLTPQIDKPLPP